MKSLNCFVMACIAAIAVLVSCEEKTEIPSLALDVTEVSLEIGKKATVNVIAGSGSYEAVIEDAAIAEVEFLESVIKVKGLAEGSTKLTVNDMKSGESLAIDVNVLPDPVLTFHTVYRFGDLTLLLDAAEEDRDKIWIDLNANGTCDEGDGEKDIDFGKAKRYKFNNDISIYGPLTVFNACPQYRGIDIDEIDLSSSRYLVALNLQANKVESLDLSACTGLQTLNVSNNRNLAVIDVTGCQDLRNINCCETAIKSLDLSGCPELTEVSCIMTPAESIEFGEIAKVTKLNIWNNFLKSVDCSNMPELVFLSVAGNELTTLDISANKKLETLSCGGNQIGDIDLSANTALKEIYMSDCGMTDAVLLSVAAPEKVEKLSVDANQLTKADLSGFISLKEARFNTNSIKKDAMTSLLESLPKHDVKSPSDYYRIFVRDSSRMAAKEEGNEYDHDAHYELCKSKGWWPYDNNSGGDEIAL